VESNKDFMGKEFNVNIHLEKPEDAETITKLFTTAGAKVDMQGADLTLAGDLGRTLEVVLNDSDAMYHNDGSKVSALYGINEKEVLKNWHTALTKIDKALKKEKLFAEAKMISDVKKKAVETAYNFYGIAPEKVSDRLGIMTGLLVFYVVYTMWYGYAIYYIFEGIGLSMKKAKVKEEV
jgi:hypothetical protein